MNKKSRDQTCALRDSSHRERDTLHHQGRFSRIEATSHLISLLCIWCPFFVNKKLREKGLFFAHDECKTKDTFKPYIFCVLVRITILRADMNQASNIWINPGVSNGGESRIEAKTNSGHWMCPLFVEGLLFACKKHAQSPLFAWQVNTYTHTRAKRR